MAKFTIVETRTVRSLNQANPTGLDTLVTYLDEAERMHVVTLPGSGLTAGQIDAGIAGVHGDRNQHRGRTIDA